MCIVSVQGQTVGVVCRASVDCAGGPGDDLGRTTERDCCVDKPLGMAYVGSEGNCTPCIGECIGMSASIHSYVGGITVPWSSNIPFI